MYATATEDMDALTFRTPKLLRKMTFSSGQKQPIIEIDIAAVLSGLDLSYESFVDLCIMMGCDYCNTIKGVGPKTALILIRQHKNLENVVKALQRNPKTKNNVMYCFFVLFCFVLFCFYFFVLYCLKLNWFYFLIVRFPLNILPKESNVKFKVKAT